MKESKECKECKEMKFALIFQIITNRQLSWVSFSLCSVTVTTLRQGGRLDLLEDWDSKVGE